MAKNFKFEDGKLIVDAAYHDPHYPGDYVLIIDGDAYLLPAGRNYQAESVLEAMRPLKFYSMKNSHEKIMEYEYVFLSCVPKDGFNVQLGRPITRVEFSLLCNEYHITDKDITDEFVKFCSQPVITVEDVLSGNYSDKDIEKMNTSERYATTVGLTQADRQHLETIKKFVSMLGEEFSAVFDSYTLTGEKG